LPKEYNSEYIELLTTELVKKKDTDYTKFYTKAYSKIYNYLLEKINGAIENGEK